MRLDCCRPKEEQEENDNEKREPKKAAEIPPAHESSKATAEPIREQPDSSNPRVSGDSPTKIEGKATHGGKSSSAVASNKTVNSIISLSRIRNNQEPSEVPDEKDVLKQRAARFEGCTIELCSFLLKQLYCRN